MNVNINETVLEDKLTQLEQVHNWSPRVISRLENMIRTADDYDLFRINPIQYAADKRMDEQEAIDLFLYSAKLGLFELEWHLVCSFCAHVVESLSELSSVHSHYKCTFCQAENDVALDDYIQVAFTISRQVRTIGFHQPEQLPIEDYYLKYHFAKGVQPLPDGTTFAQIGKLISRYMNYVEPNERVVVETEITPGMLQAKDLFHRASLVFFLQDAQADEVAIPIQLADGKFQATDHTPAPREINQTVATFHYDAADELDSGKVQLEYTNMMAERSPLWIMHYPAGFEAVSLSFAPFLSGKRLLTTQTFRDLFRSQALSDNEGIAVKEITFLFTDLKGSTDMYDRIGDLNAYYLVRQHFDALITAITNNHGSIVKTIGDAVMATFLTPVDAVQAALDMLEGIEAFNKTRAEPLLFLKIGIHRGASIAVTLNDRLDYFGQTVNIAARIQSLAGASEIYISHEAHSQPEVQDLLTHCDVFEEQVTLKGVRNKIDVCKIVLRTEDGSE